MTIEILNELHSAAQNAKMTILINKIINEKYIEKQKVEETIDRCLMDLVLGHPEEYDECILLCSIIKQKLNLEEME